jgi:hypothetical protein
MLHYTILYYTVLCHGTTRFQLAVTCTCKLHISIISLNIFLIPIASQINFTDFKMLIIISPKGDKIKLSHYRPGQAFKATGG